MNGSGIHEAARRGYSRSGDHYEKGRPEYRPRVVERLIGHLRLSRASKVMDLAAGTGKFTRHLPSFFDQVAAVEPVQAMQEAFQKAVPRVPVFTGTAEDLPFEDESFDCVFVATAFHWFDAEKAAREISRVLRPGGRLGLIWNTWRKDEVPPWLSAMRAIIEPYSKDVYRYADGRWRGPLETSRRFTALESESIDHPWPATLGEAVGRMTSVSYISALPEEEFRRVEKRLVSALTATQVPDGKYVLPFQDDLFWCFKA